MEDVQEQVKSIKKNTFMNHVFNFDDETKAELSNLVQYTILAIIPFIILNNVIDSLIPAIDEKKSNLEILVEVLGQVVLLIVGLFFIHRIVTFVPTYSGVEMSAVSLMTIITTSLVVARNTKLGAKFNLLGERVSELWNGKKESMKVKREGKDNKKEGSVIMSQPISGMTMPQATHQVSRADGYAEQHNAMSGGGMIAPPVQQSPQEAPHLNNSAYGQQGGGLQNAALPGPQGPIAANEVMGFTTF